MLFIAATVYDNKFRAFDKLLAATPSPCSVNGKQYVVVGAGGGKNAKVKPGGSTIAYSLPN